MYNKVEICGVNTARLGVLGDAEKDALMARIKNGDKKAREEMINGNLKLVLSVIRSFSNRGENPDDLFQVGCIGLIKAVDNFSTDRDVKFSTYAVPMILGEIRRFLRDNNALRVSRSLRDLAYKSLRAKEMLSLSLGREVTVDEIAKEIGAPKSDIVNALEAIVEPVSIYEPVYSEGGDAIYVLDQIKDTVNTAEKWVDDISISQAIDSLGEREKRIVLLRFYGGKTQSEVASEIGISQAQVSRLEKTALERIKKSL